MANTNVFFSIFVGDDDNVNITVLDNAGAVVDISSATAIDWRMSADEFTAPVLTKTLGAGITVTDGPNGVFQIAIASADTAALAYGTFYQSSRVTISSNLSHVATGTVWLRPNPPS
tara:strand:+ start:73 stop:420 length:348 start_codon:yes stop_codon:yes gene_type:complete